MPLPKLDVPIYELKLPSNGKKISYRPFLVKEEKILLMAVEGEDQNEMITAIKQILNNCVLTKGVKIDKLPLFDLEYILLHLRSKSMGDIIKTRYAHKECQPVEVEIDVNSIKVSKPKGHTNKIELTDTVGLIMRYPDINMMNMVNIEEQNSEEIFNLIIECVDQVYDKENTYGKADYTIDEIREFLNTLTKDQFTQIETFFQTLPKMTKEFEFECPCGYKEKILLEGLTSFFG